MSVFSSAQITKFSQQAEQDIAVAIKCIPFRVALSIVNGTAQYSLSDYCLSIREVLWKGFVLDPLPQRDLRQSLLSGTQAGRPYWYIFNNIGQLKIQLFPTPNETITADQTHLYDTNIGSQCIVDLWRAPDFSTYLIPSYFRRRLIKAYVMKECYAYESKGQNLKARDYWAKRYEQLLEDYSNIMNDLHNKPRNLVANTYNRGYPKVPRPMLPIANYGEGVDY